METFFIDKPKVTVL